MEAIFIINFIATVPSGIVNANIDVRLQPHVLIHGGTQLLPIVPICNTVKVAQVIEGPVTIHILIGCEFTEWRVVPTCLECRGDCRTNPPDTILPVTASFE